MKALSEHTGNQEVGKGPKGAHCHEGKGDACDLEGELLEEEGG